MNFTVLLFYKYITVPQPEIEREAQRALCNEYGIKGRILIGDEGINATLAGTPEACEAYRAYMDSHAQFSDIEYKIDMAETMPFPRLRVKTRPEIVTLGVAVDPADTAPRLSPEEFNTMLERDDVILFDARNNYESAIGKFEGAITPDIKLFKDLPAQLEQYADLKDKTIVTYCTGGIRCEKASALMRASGFKDVYQLDGGIIKYAQKYPKGAFKGECFVFDERMSVAFSDDAEKLGSCHFCATPSNSYINCDNARCNDMLLICADCKASKRLCLTCETTATVAV
jgi:UPF0176 protein